MQALTDKYKEEKLHSERVSRLCRKMGEALKLSEENIKELELAGLVHDIGKIAIPDAILYKPMKLNPEEFNILKNHTEVGYQILKEADEYSRLADYAKYHHERMDGLGYPSGLKGECIPYFARIICIADAFEAMTANRPYRRAQSTEFAINELRRYAGIQFDAKLVDTFIHEVATKI